MGTNFWPLNCNETNSSHLLRVAPKNWVGKKLTCICSFPWVRHITLLLSFYQFLINISLWPYHPTNGSRHFNRRLWKEVHRIIKAALTQRPTHMQHCKWANQFPVAIKLVLLFRQHSTTTNAIILFFHIELFRRARSAGLRFTITILFCAWRKRNSRWVGWFVTALYLDHVFLRNELSDPVVLVNVQNYIATQAVISHSAI